MRSRYVLITPARDEAAFARRTLETVVAQTVRPALWIIVDDGSRDQTPATVAEFAQRCDWIRLIQRNDRGQRSVGPGVIEAFYAGLAQVNLAEFDFVCKLDLDLELPSSYFDLLICRMADNPRLGTCSGKPYVRRADGLLVPERCGDEMSVGMTKFYRVSCFEQIGGFVRDVMWDGIDCHRCRMLGWQARSFDEPGLRFVHLRPMGSSQRGILTGRMRHGAGQHFMGTGLAYMTASALYRAVERPYLIGGAAMWWGYVRAMLTGRPRYDDPEFRRFLRAYQRDCLLRGKAAAAAHFDQQGAALWRLSHASKPSRRSFQPQGIHHAC